MSSLHNDYLEQQEDNRQEEEHQKFVIIQEFSRLVLSEGPASVLGQMDDEARDELKFILKREW
tara:strand:- start:1164 stop:1352 length:189 start_codon:yes stop_codon:yes gene_type:complete